MTRTESPSFFSCLVWDRWWADVILLTALRPGDDRCLIVFSADIKNKHCIDSAVESVVLFCEMVEDSGQNSVMTSDSAVQPADYRLIVHVIKCRMRIKRTIQIVTRLVILTSFHLALKKNPHHTKIIVLYDNKEMIQ